MAGLKGLILQVSKGLRCIWRGSSKRKAEKRNLFLNQWNDEDSPCDELYKERKNIKKYKHNFEKKLWQENEQKYLDGEASESVLDDSSIGEIDITLIHWFKDRWLANPSHEKIQFYLWLESVYVHHLKKYSKNKKEYFETVHQQSHNKSLIKSGKSISRLLTVILTCGGGILYITFLGSLKGVLSDILTFINNHAKGNISNAAIENISFSFIFLLGIIAAIYSWRILYREQYYKEKVPKENKRETWVRHVNAIQAYQKVILEYLEDIGDFSYCLCLEDKERHLMSQMISVWEQNAQLFQNNMRKDPEGK